LLIIAINGYPFLEARLRISPQPATLAYSSFERAGRVF
jgi:hypothetical protein